MTTLIPNTPSTIASWARLIAQAMEGCGVDSAAVFREAGLDLEQARDPNSRFPARNMSRVWALAVERSGDPCFALRLPEFAHPSMYNAFSMALISSRTMREAAECAVRYHRLASDAAELRIEETAEQFRVIYHVPPENEPVAPEALEGFIVTSTTLMRVFGGTDLYPAEVCFRHGKDSGQERYEAFFQAPVRFGADQSLVAYHVADLQRECLHANAELAGELEQWMGKYLAGYAEQSLSGELQKWLCGQLAAGNATQKQAAAQFNMSTRALQRKLQQEQTTFTRVLEQTRKGLALKYVTDADISNADMTFLLGFSDQSNFTRAFRRWTGMPPQQYRAQQAGV